MKSEPRDIGVRALLDGLRACCFATANVATHDSNKTMQKKEVRAYKDLFLLVTGRDPTPEEITHMTAGDSLARET